MTRFDEVPRQIQWSKNEFLNRLALQPRPVTPAVFASDFRLAEVAGGVAQLLVVGGIHTFMRIILTITALGLLLTACTKTTNDDSIYRRVVGVWSSDSAPGKIIENMSNGTMVVRVNGVETASGKWQVKDGYMIEGIGSSTVESNRVLSVSGDTMVVLSINGHTELTFHKQ